MARAITSRQTERPGRPRRTHATTSLAIGAVCTAAAISSALAPSSAAPARPSPEEIVIARQAGLAMSAALLGTIKVALDRGATADTQAYPAGGLSRWARALPGMFPSGTGPEAVSVATHARSEVWTQRAAFEKSADELIAATAKLRELAQDKDTLGLKNQIAVVQDACESCHQTFRKK
jgi:cytochrome c556